MFALGCIQAMKCHTNKCPTGITTHDKGLQRGLVVTDKAEKVARYADQIRHDVEMIAHACGVAEPRLIRRKHVRLVQADGRSMPMSAMDFMPPEEWDEDRRKVPEQG